MKRTVPIDKAGRVVLPKTVRDKLRLSPGDNLVVECEGERITLKPIRPQATLQKEHGIWVYAGESTRVSIPDMLDREREKRTRELDD